MRKLRSLLISLFLCLPLVGFSMETDNTGFNGLTHDPVLSESTLVADNGADKPRRPFRRPFINRRFNNFGYNPWLFYSPYAFGYNPFIFGYNRPYFLLGEVDDQGADTAQEPAQDDGSVEHELGVINLTSKIPCSNRI